MSRVSAVGLAGLAVATLVSVFAISVASGATLDEKLDSLWVLSWVGFPSVGAIIAARRPRTRIGWLLISIGAGMALGLAVTGYAERAFSAGSVVAAGLVLCLSWIAFSVAFGTIPFVLLLFPADRIASRLWRRLAWGGGAVLGVLLVLVTTRPAYQLSEETFVPNPLAIRGLGDLIESLIPVAGTALAGFGVLAAANVVYRFFRSQGEERAQMKWFAFSAAMFPVTFLVSQLLEPLSLGLSNFMGLLAFVLGFNFIAASIGIAVIRYRLYDIDLVINKTLVYGLLAAFITALYVGIVVGLGALVGAGDEPNLALSILATALVAVAFQPVRHRVQSLANRLVYGQRLSPYEAITSFSQQMTESLDPARVLPRMAEAAARAAGADRGEVALVLPTGDSHSYIWPPHSSTEGFDLSLPVTHQGETLGRISIAKKRGEPATDHDRDLLGDLASQAGLALKNLRLTEELRHRLMELQESRRRIVEAQDTERRRMERDIHDGAQQQLVAMAVRLNLAQRMLAHDPHKARTLLEELRAEAAGAVETLRDLARGIFPQVLEERGLVAALEAHVQKMGLPATIRADGFDEIRLPREIEAAVYFCIREALQNASKYAPRAQVMVRLSHESGILDFSVADEGPGFSPEKSIRGSGLQNMADRIEAIGGAFELVSAPGRGTKIQGTLSAKLTEPVG